MFSFDTKCLAQLRDVSREITLSFLKYNPIKSRFQFKMTKPFKILEFSDSDYCVAYFLK